jgi:hypothetical protein
VQMPALQRSRRRSGDFSNPNFNVKSETAGTFTTLTNFTQRVLKAIITRLATASQRLTAHLSVRLELLHIVEGRAETIARSAFRPRLLQFARMKGCRRNE